MMLWANCACAIHRVSGNWPGASGVGRQEEAEAVRGQTMGGQDRTSGHEAEGVGWGMQPWGVECAAMGHAAMA